MDDISPVSYKIHLEPDLKRFAFTGSTEIVIESDKPVNEITLNSLELAFWSSSVKIATAFVACPFFVDPKREEIKISLPEEMVGTIELKIDYEGAINDKLAGFYRSKYGTEGNEAYIGVTQFEESDARRAFPCFDHPVKKATFDVEMVVDERLVAVSNGAVLEERSLEGGKKLVRFECTPKMSTYLLFFGVGEFEFIEDPGEVLVRAATMPGLTQYAHFGLEFGRKALNYCEDYFGVDYPLSKLDLLAIPDFAFGAMENWGAMTFRENLLLHFPDITSQAGEERICEVIAHEITHQWFGNLVSPSDWKYLWLNESFATYFGYRIVSHYYPEWDIGDQFLRVETDTALRRDSLHATFPIEIPGGEHVVINVSTAPIIYNKGGSILRQVEGYIGNKSFKEGLRHYLKKHEYGSASSHHLWQAIEEASEEPVTAMMQSWIEQPGFPIVEATRDGDQLIISQKRFTYLPNGFDQEWVIPITVKTFTKNGTATETRALLDSKSTSLTIGNDTVAYKVNYGQTGFYRVKYCDQANMGKLGELVRKRKLPSEDRWGLENDLYALVKSGAASFDEYLEFVSSYEDEDAFLPLISIADNLFQTYLITEGATKEKVASFGKSFLEKKLLMIGYEPDEDEKHTTSILRDQIIVHAALYGSNDVTTFARDTFDALMRNKRVHPDLMKSVMQVGALHGDSQTFSWFAGKFTSTESEHERMNVLAALGSFGDESLIEKTRHYVLENVPDRNKFVPLSHLAANPSAMPSMWEWYVANVEQLEAFPPVHYERVIAAIVPVCGLGKKEEVKAFFEKYLKQKNKARDVIQLSLERLEINERIRAL
jgi:aminopeptidase N